jgi:hypothetical protein
MDFRESARLAVRIVGQQMDKRGTRLFRNRVGGGEQTRLECFVHARKSQSCFEIFFHFTKERLRDFHIDPHHVDIGPQEQGFAGLAALCQRSARSRSRRTAPSGS